MAIITSSLPSCAIFTHTGMNHSLSVFLDFSLPIATTWFYFSWLLAVALFFKFSRLLSIRNWDVVTVFLLVPGLLAIQGAHHDQAMTAAQTVGQSAACALGTPAANFAVLGAHA